MGTNLTNQLLNPNINVKEISDQYIRKNFQNLSSYFSTQNQLLNFKFYEIVFTAATANYNLVHGLGVIPQDVIMMNCVGSGTVSFNFGLSTATNLNITTTGAMRIRFMVGTYWNWQTTYQFKKTDQMTFTATPISSTTTSTSAASSTISTAASNAPASTVAGVYGNIQFLTNNYTALITDESLFCSSNAFTVALFNASGNAGRTIYIEKTDASFSNIITISGSGYSTTLNTQGEAVLLKSDGTTFRVMQRYIPSTWSNQGTISFSSTGGAIVPGTIGLNRVLGMRNGNKYFLKYEFYQTTLGTTQTGIVLVQIPGGLIADTNLISIDTTTNGSSTGTADVLSAIATMGGGGWIVDATNSGRGTFTPKLYDSTHLTGLISYNGSNIGTWPSSSSFSLGMAHLGFSFEVGFPVKGWAS